MSCTSHACHTNIILYTLTSHNSYHTISRLHHAHHNHITTDQRMSRNITFAIPSEHIAPIPYTYHTLSRSYHVTSINTTHQLHQVMSQPTSDILHSCHTHTTSDYVHTTLQSCYNAPCPQHTITPISCYIISIMSYHLDSTFSPPITPCHVYMTSYHICITPHLM